MAGFWTGLAQGYSTAKDRIEKRKLFQQEILEKRRDALIPIVAKRQQAEQEYKKAQNQVKSFFAARLKDTDVPPEQMQAFINIAASDPERGLQLMEYVQKFEVKNETRLAGDDLIRATRVFEDTKPEDMEIDEWIEVAANISATDDEGGFNAGATIDRIVGATAEELRQLSVELTGPVGGGAVGGNTSLGVDQSYQTSDMVERANRSGSSSNTTAEGKAVDVFFDQINTKALRIQEDKFAEVEEILGNEELELQAARESEEEAKNPNSATARRAAAEKLRSDMIRSNERLERFSSGATTAQRLAAIPEDILFEAAQEVYQENETFRSFYEGQIENPTLDGDRATLFNVFTGNKRLTYTPPETAQVEATQPDVEVSIPELVTPEVGVEKPTPDFTVSPMDAPDYAPDPYSNTFQDKFNQ